MKLYQKGINNIIAEETTSIQKRKIKRKKKSGEIAVYKNYVAIFPQLLTNFFKKESEYIYFYKIDEKVYLTSVEPPATIKYMRRKIMVDSEGSRIALPKNFFVFNDEKKERMLFKVFLDMFDYISGDIGLVEVDIV